MRTAGLNGKALCPTLALFISTAEGQPFVYLGHTESLKPGWSDATTFTFNRIFTLTPPFSEHATLQYRFACFFLLLFSAF